MIYSNQKKHKEMGLTAAERKKLFMQTLSGNDESTEEPLIAAAAKPKEEEKKEEKKEPKAEKVTPVKKQKVVKKQKEAAGADRLKNLEAFFAISKEIREVVDQEFGSDEKQITYTTGMYPRYVSLLKRMSKSVGISQGAILSAALCNMLSCFPEDEKKAIIKDEVNEIW